jgi:hypothetical protein
MSGDVGSTCGTAYISKIASNLLVFLTLSHYFPSSLLQLSLISPPSLSSSLLQLVGVGVGVGVGAGVGTGVGVSASVGECLPPYLSC